MQELGAALKQALPSGVTEAAGGKRWHARPDNSAEVARILGIATEMKVRIGPVVEPGADGPGIELDLSGLAEIHAMNEEALTVHAGAGLRVRDLEVALRDHGFTLGFPMVPHLDPKLGGFLSSHGWAEASVEYGHPCDAAIGIEGVLATGRQFRIKPAPRRAVGPDLAQLFLGAEGRLGVLTSAYVRFHPAPKARKIAAAAMPGPGEALRCAARAVHEGLRPGFGRIVTGAGTAEPCLVLGFEGEPRLVEVFYALASALVRDAGGSDLPEDYPLANRTIRAPCPEPEKADHVTVSAGWAEAPGVLRVAREVLGESFTACRISDLVHEGCSITLTARVDRTASVEEAHPELLVRLSERVRSHGGFVTAHHGQFAGRASTLVQSDPAFANLALTLGNLLDPQGILEISK